MDQTKLEELRGLAFDPRLGLFDCFARVRDIAPDHVALVSGSRSLTYMELSRAAEAVADRLLTMGLGQGAGVAIVAGRSIETIVAMLGVLKAGGYFVPLDPEYDSKHLAFIIEDAKPSVILHVAGYGDLAASLAPPGVTTLCIEDASKPSDGQLSGSSAAEGGALCYIMYTSGSTGRPKGVMVAQRSVQRLGFDQPVSSIRPGDVMLHSSTIAADGSVGEIWCPLVVGGTLAILAEPKPSLDKIADAIVRHEVTVAAFYTGVFHLLAEHRLPALAGLRTVIVGGDVLSASLSARLIKANPKVRLCNLFGPTETTVYITAHHVTQDDLGGAPIPIGLPERWSDCFVLDDDTKTELGDGDVGQLACAGPGVAQGYLNLPEITAERFIDDPRPGRSGKAYLTGDMVLRRPDGIYEFVGRRDRQVKIGGRRIELDAIEHGMRQVPLLSDVVVDVISPKAGHKRIVAFAKPRQSMPADQRSFTRAVLEEARKILGDEMVPRSIFLFDDLPLAANGKVDRKKLVSQAEAALDESAPAAQDAPASAGRQISAMVALIADTWDAILSCGAVDGDTTFFEAGGTSLQLIDAHAALEQKLGRRFDITLMFETPRLRALAERLVSLKPDKNFEKTAETEPNSGPSANSFPDGAIAIVGLAARVPGCATLADFWAHVRAGDNLIPHFDAMDLEDAFSKAERAAGNYVPARPVLEDADMFDAKFFGMYPREADLADPQGRVFLEVCYEALEDAGHDPARSPGPVGVFAGATMSTYLIHNLLGNRARAEDLTSNFQVGNYAELTGNIADTLATRVSYKLNLTGPAYTVATACSTSLTAISQAVLNLRTRQCDMALAGGVSITFPQKRGYMCVEGGMVSPDGVCRPFDAEAGGTVFGHGAGVVVLRRLADALADGDQIYAVIRGVGVNNDGADKIAFTAPSVTGQANAIRTAHRDAEVVPETVSYVECHGTATPLGDPIEVRGLSEAFGPASGPGTCALGSVKGNIGHLDAAAGVISTIKTALMLKHGEIPKLANFQKLNPKIDFANGPFRIPTATEAWPGGAPRRAGISSFGVGGTNTHLVLEEAPARAAPEQTDRPQILPLSAKSPEALVALQARLADALESPDAPSLPQAAFTLQDGRQAYEYRAAVAAGSNEDAAAALRKLPAPRRPVAEGAPPVAFLFPGQGSQYPGMGSGLYRSEPVFADWIDRGADILEPILGININSLLCFGETGNEDAARALRDTRLTQPALYLTQFACAKLWEARGVVPTAMIGHSVGEFTAAALSGVFDFETGLRVIAARGRLMQDQPPGAMLSVRATMEDLAPYLDGSVDVAARNAPRLNVLAGSNGAVAAMAAKLEADGIACSPLHTSHAFHSSMMNPVCDSLAAEIAQLKLTAPAIPYVSCVTGNWITEAEATDPAYWARQARQAVNFAESVSVLAENGPPVLVECGAGGVLSAFSAQSLPRDGHAGIVQSLPDHRREMPEEIAMATALGRLWSLGVDVDWARSGTRGDRRVSLPTYPFQRKRHWVEPPAPVTRGGRAAEGAARTPETVSNKGERASNRPALAPAAPAPVDRRERLTAGVLAMLVELSGEELRPEDATASFLELGFDSLFLGQVAQRLAADYGASLTFRQLLSDYPSAQALATHLDETLPPDPVASETATVATDTAQTVPAPEGLPMPGLPAMPALSELTDVSQEDMAALLDAQMKTMQAIFAQQLSAVTEWARARAGSTPSPKADDSPSSSPQLLAENSAGPATPANDAPSPKATAFAEGLRETQPEPRAATDAAPTKRIPLTEAQREIWLTSQLSDDASCAFNESVSLRLEGPLDVDALRRSLARLIARHDGLRQVFARNGETFDIRDPFDPDVPLVDLSHDADPEAALSAVLAKDVATPIDLITGPALRICVARLTEGLHVLVLTAHHIICDGWSFNILFSDLARIYGEETGGAPAALPPAPSFAAHATQAAVASVRPEVTAFWREVYADVPDLPELPTDRPRQAIKNYSGATTTAHIDIEVIRAARKAGARAGCTLFSTLFAALQTVLARLSNEKDVVLGVPTSGQSLLENPALVGHCVNFLPIRAAIDSGSSMEDHLRKVVASVLNAFEHKDYTFGTLVRELGIERSLNRLPLTEVLFNLDKLDEALSMGALTATITPNPKSAVNFDLFFNMVERSDGLRLDVFYNSALYDEATVQRWVGHLETVLRAFAADLDRPAASFPILSEAQRTALIEGTNATAAAYPQTETLQALLAQSSAAHPERIAVEDAKGTMTYGALETRSDAIAARIQSELPEPGARVAVALHRSAGCLAAMLGVMKAGHAYVPLDPGQPVKRLQAVIAAAEAQAVLVDGDAGDWAGALGVCTISMATVPVDAAPRPVPRMADPTAYVIFTSGSTGVPKGVEIGHRSLINFLTSMAETPGFGAQDTMLAVTTTTFDIAALELFLPLLQGGKLVIAPRMDVLDAFKLVERIARGDITHVQATPTLWGMLLEAGFKPEPGLTMLCGGEPMPSDLAHRLTDGGGALWNLYGPTETTIWSAVERIERGAPITIGRPIANTALHVLTDNDDVAPVGAVGELWIGGDGLAKGYFARPDLTAAAFREIDLGRGAERLYRTGDMARRRADGKIEVLGRRDDQIKLRGFRIELGEIESALRAVDGIEAAAAALRPSPRGGEQLVGFVVRDRSREDALDLAAALADRLPDYMIPTAWVTLSDLPQTANGKLDRKALPTPDAMASVTALHTGASTATERRLLEIWEEVLGIQNISTTATLYALGADSLTVFRIAARMIDAGLNLEARDLLRHPSIAQLAAYADARDKRSSAPAKPLLAAYRGGAKRGI